MSSSSMVAIVWHSVSCCVDWVFPVWHSVSCDCFKSSVWQIASVFSFSILLKVKLSFEGMTWCYTSLNVSSGGGGFDRRALKDA